jgi:hypothetical protein
MELGKLISEDYLKQQQALHNDKSYGVSGHKWASKISHHKDILDYGCGKKTLEEALNRPIANYDPCVKGLENNNHPHDFVFCGDVLEHIELHLLDNVLQDIKRCMIDSGLLVISLIPAKKTLPDGRNAHLILETHHWWKDKLANYFIITNEEVNDKEYVVEVKPWA